MGIEKHRLWGGGEKRLVDCHLQEERNHAFAV
jgi:hypothetical protein